MKTRLIVFAVAVSAVLWATSGTSRAQIFVANGGSDTIGEYDATTGAPINPALISGLNGPLDVALSGGNLFVTNFLAGTIGEYNATTGAPRNSALVSGLNLPAGIVVRSASVPDASSSRTLMLLSLTIILALQPLVRMRA